jgi:tetratricopeptide (TPR) repeat protein
MGASIQTGQGANGGVDRSLASRAGRRFAGPLGSCRTDRELTCRGLFPALLIGLLSVAACRGPLGPDERDRTWAAAERASRSGDWTSAASLWNELRLGDEAGGPRPCAETVRALLALGKTDEALALAEASVERFPKDSELRALRADILSQLGFPRAAEAELLIATRLAPDVGRYWLELATVQLALSSPQSAAHSILQAERCASLSATACDPNKLALVAARCARSQAFYGMAQERYHRAVELAQNSPTALEGPLHSPGFEPGELPPQPTRIELLVEAASLYTTPDSPAPEPATLELALSWSAEASRQDPQFVCAHFVHAVLLERAGRGEEALSSYRRAVEVDGHHLGATTNLALLCRQMGRWNEAQGLFERALRLEQDPERRAQLSALSAENPNPPAPAAPSAAPLR